jgi:protein SCO1/2
MNETFVFMLLLALLSGAPDKPRPGHARQEPPHAAATGVAYAGASPGALVQRARRAAAAPLVPHLGARLPLEERFVDDAGHTVRLADYFTGVPVLLLLGNYQCPGQCSTVMDGILQSVAALDLPSRQYRVLAVSIDPSEHAQLAAQKKASYRQLPGGATVRLDLLTGGGAAIARLAAATGYAYAWDSARRQYPQPAGFVVAAGDGTIARYFPDMRFDGRDLRLALVQASRGAAGDLSDRVVLMWSRFDPATGRYTGPGGQLAGTGGALMATLLASSLWLLRRRARKGVRPAPIMVRRAPPARDARRRAARPEADHVREP